MHSYSYHISFNVFIFISVWTLAKSKKSRVTKLVRAVNCHLSMTLIRESCLEYFINWLTGISLLRRSTFTKVPALSETQNFHPTSCCIQIFMNNSEIFIPVLFQFSMCPFMNAEIKDNDFSAAWERLSDVKNFRYENAGD